MSHHEHRARAAGRSAGVGLLTVSDSRTESTDRSGAAARRLIEAAGHRVVAYRIVPDEPEQVRGQVRDWLADEECEAVIVNGGTGLSKRDRTFEALSGLLERRLDGFGELFRMLSYEQIGSAAMLSRAMAGVASGKAVFSVPGSTAAVELALEKLIAPELGHLLAELRRR